MKFKTYLHLTINIGTEDPIKVCKKIETETSMKTTNYFTMDSQIFVGLFGGALMNATFVGSVEASDYLDARSRLANLILIIKEFFNIKDVDCASAEEEKAVINKWDDLE